MTAPHLEPAEVLTVGETMGCLLLPDDAAQAGYTFIGAESNVAIGLAGLGHGVRWAGRLGADRAGERIVAALRDRGVLVDVARDEERQTGLAVKEIGPGETRVRYYRRDSAAAAMDETTVPALAGAAWLHLTGVTPALSASCGRAVRALVEAARTDGVTVSLDLNYRAALWPSPDVAAGELRSLARRADVVFLGEDEAEALGLGGDLSTIRESLGLDASATLVLKRGGEGSEASHGAETFAARAIRTPVVDLTGAGDAHAAGFISGRLRGLPTGVCLGLGSALAARVVGVAQDVADAPTAAETEQMLRDAVALEVR